MTPLVSLVVIWDVVDLEGNAMFQMFIVGSVTVDLERNPVMLCSTQCCNNATLSVIW